MSRKHRPLALLGTLALAATFALSAVPTQAADTSANVGIELTRGTLAANIADLDLPAVQYAHTFTPQGGNMTLTVDDSTGDGAGWNVTVVSSDFVYTGEADGGMDIPASNFTIGTPATPAMTAGLDITSDGPFAGVGGTLDAARKVIYANTNGGLGTYTQNLPVTLTIPAQSRVGTYDATLTVTVSAGPGE